MKPAVLRSLVAVIGLSSNVAWTAEASSPDANGPPVVDRASFFIGNTIANLRGLDPVFLPGQTLTLIDGRRLPASSTMSAPTTTFTSKALQLPVGWTGAPVSERRSCGAYGCSDRVDLLMHRADGSTRVFSTNLSGGFIALPRLNQLFDCAQGVSTREPMGPAIVDLNGTKTMLPAHPGPLRVCASVGTGDEVLLVYSMANARKAYSLARVFDANGALLAEGAYEDAGTVKFKVAGKRHSAVVPAP